MRRGIAHMHHIVLNANVLYNIEDDYGYGNG